MYDEDLRLQAGQIWEVNAGNGRPGKVVVIAVQSNFANTMSIWDGDNPANFPLAAGGDVDTRKMIYTNVDNFRCLIDYASENELRQIKNRFAYSIGVEVDGAREEKEAEPEQPVDVRLIVAERERDIWKSVAQSLMQK